jgi:hypothetical protein
MDPVRLKKAYGGDLVLCGGSDVRHWANLAKVDEDIRAILPAMMESGGVVHGVCYEILLWKRGLAGGSIHR